MGAMAGMETRAERMASETKGDTQELAGEAQEHTEVGTAIEIRRVRDTVIRTE